MDYFKYNLPGLWFQIYQQVLDKVSDKQIEAEYHRRFSLKAGDSVNSSEDAARHFAGMLTKETSRECFVVMFLNGQNALLTSEILFKGTLATSAVYPREIVKTALKNSAAAIICAHNHPSGNLNPSRDDLSITKKIKAACDTVDIPLHDHLIIAGDGWYSLADHGLI